jgi:hypothetical protein
VIVTVVGAAPVHASVAVVLAAMYPNPPKAKAACLCVPAPAKSTSCCIHTYR